MNGYLLTILLISLLLPFPGALIHAREEGTKIVWHWEDDFSPAEKQKVESWLTRVTWDEILGRALFSELLHIYQNAPASEILESLP